VARDSQVSRPSPAAHAKPRGQARQTGKPGQAGERDWACPARPGSFNYKALRRKESKQVHGPAARACRSSTPHATQVRFRHDCSLFIGRISRGNSPPHTTYAAAQETPLSQVRQDAEQAHQALQALFKHELAAVVGPNRLAGHEKPRVSTPPGIPFTAARARATGFATGTRRRVDISAIGPAPGPDADRLKVPRRATARNLTTPCGQPQLPATIGSTRRARVPHTARSLEHTARQAS